MPTKVGKLNVTYEKRIGNKENKEEIQTYILHFNSN